MADRATVRACGRVGGPGYTNGPTIRGDGLCLVRRGSGTGAPLERVREPVFGVVRQGAVVRRVVRVARPVTGRLPGLLLPLVADLRALPGGDGSGDRACAGRRGRLRRRCPGPRRHRSAGRGRVRSPDRRRGGADARSVCAGAPSARTFGRDSELTVVGSVSTGDRSAGQGPGAGPATPGRPLTDRPSDRPSDRQADPPDRTRRARPGNQPLTDAAPVSMWPV